MPIDVGHFTQEHGASDYGRQACWGKGWSYTESAVIKFTLQFPVAQVLEFWWVTSAACELEHWQVRTCASI